MSCLGCCGSTSADTQQRHQMEKARVRPVSIVEEPLIDQTIDETPSLPVKVKSPLSIKVPKVMV